MENYTPNSLEDAMVETAIEKLSPSKKVLNFIKKFLVIFIVFKWIWLALKEVGKVLKVMGENHRRAIKMSITDRYDEAKVWITVFWMKMRYLFIGIVVGVLLEFHKSVYIAFLDLLELVTDVFRQM